MYGVFLSLLQSVSITGMLCFDLRCSVFFHHRHAVFRSQMIFVSMHMCMYTCMSIEAFKVSSILPSSGMRTTCQVLIFVDLKTALNG